ncbi:MAG: hypothetical protein ACYTHK_19790 [Planctomycetota bacterium]
MGRIGLALLLWVLGGCTSLLAAQGDPDLSILRRGAYRAEIEDEMGKPKVIQPVEEGRYIAIYVIKLGAPKNVDAKGESLKYIGQGAGATIASGAFSKVVNSVAYSGGWSSSATGNAAAAAAIGLTVWAAGELAGTVRELTRLARRRKHSLEVVYDHRGRMLSHQLTPMEGRRLPVTMAERPVTSAPSQAELESRWRKRTYSVRTD